MKKLLCYLDLHSWRYYKKEYYFKYTEPRLAMMTGNRSVPLRECRWCNKRQHHLMLIISHARYIWKPWNVKPGSKIIQK